MKKIKEIDLEKIKQKIVPQYKILKRELCPQHLGFENQVGWKSPDLKHELKYGHVTGGWHFILEQVDGAHYWIGQIDGPDHGINFYGPFSKLAED